MPRCSLYLRTASSLISAKGQQIMATAPKRMYSSIQKALLQDVFETKEEERVFKKLNKALSPSALSVKDISGGCGSMFAIKVKSTEFNNLTTIKQHMLVNRILKEEISNWHGVQLVTKKDKQ